MTDYTSAEFARYRGNGIFPQDESWLDGTDETSPMTQATPADCKAQRLGPQEADQNEGETK